MSTEDDGEALALVKVKGGEGGFEVGRVTSAEAERELWKAKT
jgi:hypothetical protein